MGQRHLATEDDVAKDKNGGLFEEPKKQCQHRSTHQNEHQIVCNDCGQVVGDAPH